MCVFGLIMLAAAPSARASWVESSPGWYENTSTGERQLWNKAGEVVKSWTKDEWQAWANYVDGYAANAAQNDGRLNDLVNQIINDTPGITQGEAQDAAGVITKTRGGVSDSVSSALDGIAAEGGGALTVAQMAGALGTGLGAVLLGPSAFKFGVELGNGVDQFLGLPTWELYRTEDQAEVGGACELGASETEPSHSEGIPKVSPRGYYYHCGANPYVGEGMYKLPNYCVEHEPSCGVCAPVAPTYSVNTAWLNLTSYHEPGCGSGEKGERLWFLGYVLKQVAYAPESEKTSGVPVVGPMTKAQEEANTGQGLPAKPVVTLPAPKRERHTTEKQKEGFTGGPAVVPGPGVSEGALKEHEGQQKNKSLPSPGPKYMQENQEHAPEAKSEAPAEPTPAAVTGPTIPPIEWPGVPTPCNKFPFGIPCWIVEQISSLVATPRAPEASMSVLGITTMHFHFSEYNSIMSIIRTVEAVLVAIGVVLMFGRFASSGSASNDGGGGDD